MTKKVQNIVLEENVNKIVLLLIEKDLHQSPEQLVAHNVIFIETTSVEIIICTYILISGLIAQPVSENLY